MVDWTPVEVMLWSVVLSINSSSTPEPASFIHCLVDCPFTLSTLCCFMQKPDVFFKLLNVSCRRDPDVKSQLKPEERVSVRNQAEAVLTHLSGTTLVWTPPLIIVRLTVLTSPSVLLGSACNFAFSWALCSKKTFQMTLISWTFIPVGQQFVDHILSLLSSSVF